MLLDRIEQHELGNQATLNPASSLSFLPTIYAWGLLGKPWLLANAIESSYPAYLIVDSCC